MQSNTLTAGCRALAATTLAVALMGTAVAKERVVQIREASAQTRVLPANASRSILTAASSTRVCEAGAKWMRLDFRSLKLQGYDSLVLKSSGGDRYVLQGKHWNNRSFSSRALRGSCVDIQPYFSSRDSGYDVASFSYGTRALTAEPVVVAGAGDICDSNTQYCKATSDLIVEINPTAVFTAGDNTYENGTLSEFTSMYEPSWGRFKSKIRPAPGNHEYQLGNANGYFDYFTGVLSGTGADRTKGYYSWDVGDWHFISLNTMSGSSISTAQMQWLRDDLAANTKPCTAAYFHHPRWSVGYYSNNANVQPFYDELYKAKADLILVGHDHNYQRSKKINASGQPAADGFRQVLVGTGGRGFYSFRTTDTNVAEVHNDKTHGVLKLTLSATSYVADFVPVIYAGQTPDQAFRDNFSATCNKANTGTTYSVSGNVTNSAGTGIAGVTVSNGSVSATTSSTGAYTLSGLANGSYTLTPALSGYSFSPISRTVAVSGANVTGLSFTGTALATTFSVSGTVTNASGAALSGVSVSNGSTTVTTNSSGQYTFANLANGSYTLTPSLSGYTFSPASRPVTVSNANITAQNFTGSAVSTAFSVSGTVRNASGTGIGGVSVSNGSTTVTTNSSGQYTFSSVSNGSYTLRPSLNGYTFSPTALSVMVSGGNVSGQNFTGTVTSGATPLTKGVAVTGLGAAAGNSLDYTLVVPAGATNLTFRTSGNNGDADIYVRFGSAATTTAYACRSVDANSNEVCTIATPQAGTYHVHVDAFETFSGVSLVGNYAASSNSVQTYATGDDKAILYNWYDWSKMQVSGRSGYASATSVVEVNVVHDSLSDVKIYLYTPSGDHRLLHEPIATAGTVLNKKIVVDLSGEWLTGAWYVGASNKKTGAVGRIDSWSITF
jgi:hypothetical protein